jgi:hypothetical protein
MKPIALPLGGDGGHRADALDLCRWHQGLGSGRIGPLDAGNDVVDRSRRLGTGWWVSQG